MTPLENTAASVRKDPDIVIKRFLVRQLCLRTVTLAEDRLRGGIAG